jgi:hypothetical protein
MIDELWGKAEHQRPVRVCFNNLCVWITSSLTGAEKSPRTTIPFKNRRNLYAKIFHCDVYTSEVENQQEPSESTAETDFVAETRLNTYTQFLALSQFSAVAVKCSQVVTQLEVPPAIPRHPSIGFRDLRRATSQHDEVGNSRRRPIIEVIKRKGVADLVEVGVGVLCIDILQKVPLRNTLAPVTASAAAEARSEPERVIVVAVRTSRATSVIAILMEGTTIRLGTLRDGVAVDVGVDLDAAVIFLQQSGIR